MRISVRPHERVGRVYGLIAEFASPEAVLEAARKTRAAGYTRAEAYTPFPVEGLAAALGMRRTRVPVTVGGVDLAEGELVCAWVASANRDEAVFDDPYRFDPARELNPHVGLGIGAHRCIGGPAAQVALGVFMTEVVGAVGQIELIGDVGHLFSNFINGITHMQVGFHR